MSELKVIKLCVYLKRFIFVFLITISFTCISVRTFPQDTYRLCTYQDVEHIFFHPLLLQYKKQPNDYIQNWFINLQQFIRIVNFLYKNDYCLIDVKYIFDIDGKPKPFFFPADKKPLIISIDDLNYYDRMKEYGTAEKLVLEEGVLFSQIGDKLISNFEVVTFIDAFVDIHPDFSFLGGKGIIAVTGYHGVFGYTREEWQEAKLVADYLKQKGWRFASHGYAHLGEPRLEPQALEYDCYMWKLEVERVVGKTDIHIFPFGESLKENHTLYPIFQKHGFKYYFGVNYLSDWKIQKESMYQNRIPIDGKYLRGWVKNSKSSQFFDTSEL